MVMRGATLIGARFVRSGASSAAHTSRAAEGSTRHRCAERRRRATRTTFEARRRPAGSRTPGVGRAAG